MQLLYLNLPKSLLIGVFVVVVISLCCILFLDKSSSWNGGKKNIYILRFAIHNQISEILEHGALNGIRLTESVRKCVDEMSLKSPWFYILKGGHINPLSCIGLCLIFLFNVIPIYGTFNLGKILFRLNRHRFPPYSLHARKSI